MTIRFFCSLRTTVLLAVSIAAFAGCTTIDSSTGRSRNVLMTDRGLKQGLARDFEAMKQRETLESDPTVVSYVNCVAMALVAEIPDPELRKGWEVAVFRSKEPHVFAWTGGKIGISTNVISLMNSSDVLSAAFATQVAAVVERHSSEYLARSMSSSEWWSGLGKAIIGLPAKPPPVPEDPKISIEADSLGMMLMAQAGFDPHAIITFLSMLRPSEVQAQRLEHAQDTVSKYMDAYRSARQVHGVARCNSISTFTQASR